jgi:hypothetical protein
VVLQDVRQVKDSSGATVPYFRYYTYDSAVPPKPTVELKPPFTDADRKRIVKVVVAFKPGTLGQQDVWVDSDFVNSVTTDSPTRTPPTSRREGRSASDGSPAQTAPRRPGRGRLA